MAIDRDATLKQAEKLLRQGKLDGAIAEYVRLVQEQPRDWNAINALGDLYVRAGDRDRAVAQFAQIGDHLFTEGFLPKAAALYKKALKVKADHDHTLIRLSEIAAQQGLLADARVYLRQLERQRCDRGDASGAADCVVRLAMLEEADAETRLAGARAAREIGDASRAVALFKQAAEAFSKAGASALALEALTEAADLDPSDLALRNQLAKESVAAGHLDKARGLLTRESAGSDPDLLLALGRMELTAGNIDDARGAFTRLMTVAPERGEVLLALAGELAAEGALDAALSCADVLVDDALLASDWDRAIHVLRSLTARHAHPPTLVKLVELAIDAGRDDVAVEAQRALADAYVTAGRGEEARVIAEDLVTRFPDSDEDVVRLRQALAQAGVEDVEAIVDRCREPATGADVLDFDLDIPELRESAATPDAGAEAAVPERQPEAIEPEAEAVPLAVARIEEPDALPLGHEVGASPLAEPLAGSEASIVLLDTVEEIDLTDALAQLATDVMTAAVEETPPRDDGESLLTDRGETPDEEVAAPPEPSPPPPDLETVFEQFRLRAVEKSGGREAGAQYDQGVRHLDHGRVDEAVAELEAAAKTPQHRFRASARLGRLYAARGDFRQAVDWLERAAQAPAGSMEEGWAVLYDLAGALERMGEGGRALAVLMEIEADGAGYRDVRTRIEELARAQAGRA